LRKEVNYEHVISKNEVKPLKILAVKEFPCPQTSKNIKQFLGYYRQIISNFSKIAKLLLKKLLKKDEKFI